MHCLSMYSKNDVISRTMARYARFPLRHRCGKQRGHRLEPCMLKTSPDFKATYAYPGTFYMKVWEGMTGKKANTGTYPAQMLRWDNSHTSLSRMHQKQGNSPVYPDFIRFIRQNPALWREAKREACPMDTQAYGRFLNQVKHALQKDPKQNTS